MKPVARLGDQHTCPAHGPNAIVGVSTASKCDNLPIATIGDTTACGATIITGSPSMMVDGKPVATLGSQTSHGGTITTGSASSKA